MKPPTWLDPTARKFWKKVAPPLADLGILSDTTADLLASGCQAYSAYRHALDMLHQEGRVITTKTGAVKSNPWCAVEKQAFEMLVRVWKELGIPGRPTAPPADELEDFLGA